MSRPLSAKPDTQLGSIELDFEYFWYQLKDIEVKNAMTVLEFVYCVSQTRVMLDALVNFPLFQSGLYPQSWLHLTEFCD